MPSAEIDSPTFKERIWHDNMKTELYGKLQSFRKPMPQMSSDTKSSKQGESEVFIRTYQ